MGRSLFFFGLMALRLSLCMYKEEGGGEWIDDDDYPVSFFFWVNFYSSLISRNGEKKRETSVSL